MTDESPYAAPTTSSTELVSPPPGTRPVGVTIVAILCLIFAAMSFFGLVVTVGLMLLDPEITGPNPTVDLMKDNDFFRNFSYAGIGLGAIAGVVLIFAGVKLLGMRDIGRKAANAYSVYAILMALVGVVVNIMVVAPALTVDLGASEATERVTFISAIVGAVVGALFSIGFAVAILIVLNRKSIRHLYR